MRKWFLSLVLGFTVCSVLFSAERAIELKEISANIEIAGRIARTEVLLEFYNPNDRVMEYELNIPLSQSQAISGFALDVNGEMVDAVPVEKTKGRQVFEDVVRRGVDPGLLEKTAGNNFKLRIYPINPGKTRKARITYTENLVKGLEGHSYAFSGVPFGKRADRISVKASVAEVRPLDADFLLSGVGFEYVRNQNSYIAEVEKEDVEIGSDVFRVRIPEVENSASVGDFNGERFFLYQIPASPDSEQTDAFDLGRDRLVIIWDASLSQKKAKGKNLEFLEAFFKANRNCLVSLVVFRDAPEAPKSFVIRGGDWNELRRELSQMTFDGCASFDFLGSASEKPCKTAMLFSDGLDYYSEKPDISGFAENLFCISCGAGSNMARLSGLVRQTNGKVVDLDMFEDMNDAVSYMYRVDGVHVVWSENTEDVFTNSIGGETVVVGKMAAGNRKVRLKLSSGEEVEISPSNAFRFDEIAKMWANAKIGSLQATARLHKAEIRRISTKYGVVSDESSLIMLESADDYAKYGIEPPKPFRDEYDSILASRKSARSSSLFAFKREWDNYVEWWERDFPKDDKKPMIYKSKSAGIDFMSMNNPAARSSAEYVVDAAAVYDAMPASLRAAAPTSMALSVSEAQAERELELSEESGPAPDDEDAAQPEEQAIVRLAKWNPDSDFARRIKASHASDAYAIYLDERDDYENSPGFYLECAEMLFDKGLEDLSKRVLSNLAEISFENRSVLKLLGNRLLQLGDNSKASLIFTAIIEMAPDEPQSYLDLGIACERSGEYQKAIETLYEIFTRDGMRDFPAVKLIAMKEIDSIVFRENGLDTSFIDPYFIRDMPLDLRISLSWDTDNTDIDLHVIDPNGDETYYGHKQSYQGGRNSDDNTSGFGPEDYSLKIAKKGKYRVEVNFYGDYQQKLTDGTYVYLDFYTNWGTSKQERKSVVMKLKGRRDRVFVGEIEI
ncbi:MAG TPA: hypothetical protein DCO86_03400 [Spirochaetaceae bacterium]|nr:hypothetical protein [Spirochaetaceae bacterium]